MKFEQPTTTDVGIKEKILASAIEVFSSQGRQGARMEHIAQLAGVNKALVYYHFHNRDDLYKAAFKQQFVELLSEVLTELEKQPYKGDDAATALKLFVRAHFRAVSKHKRCVRMFIGGTADDPELARNIVREITMGQLPPLAKNLIKVIENGVESGKFRPVNPKHLIVSIMSLNLFFFVARPIAETMLDLQIEDEELYLEERLTSILDLLLYGVVERRTE